jgi:hypothetical protein
LSRYSGTFIENEKGSRPDKEDVKGYNLAFGYPITLHYPGKPGSGSKNKSTNFRREEWVIY